MASSYNIILRTMLLFYFSCNLVTVVSSKSSRDSFFAEFRLICFPSTNASNSYLNNINLLLSDFNQQSSLTRFYNTSIGTNTTDRVFGYYMCRADLGLDVCNRCIVSGTQQATFPGSCEGVSKLLLSDKCIFRYTNHSMYGMWDGRSSAVSDNVKANVSNFEQFDKTLTSTMEDLINEAAFESQNNNGSTLGFATVESRVTGDETIYSLAQCTPDIVGVNCSRCLQSGLNKLRDGSPAAFYLEEKCYLRYDYSNAGTGLISSNLFAVYIVVLLFVYNFIELL